LHDSNLTCTVCGAAHKRPAPYPEPPRHSPPYAAPPRQPTLYQAPQRHAAPHPAPPRYTPVPSPAKTQGKGKQITGAIAVISALIIFVMQINWISFSINVGDMSSDLMVDAVSHESIWDVMNSAGIAGEFDQSISSHPSLVDMINALTNMIDREIREFSDRVLEFDPLLFLYDPHSFNPHSLVSDSPDMTGIADAFSELILWEVMRVLEGIDEMEQNISISDLPNLIGFINLITDMVIREGPSWGMETDDVHSFRQNTEPIQMAEQIISILRIVFAFCVLLLVIFMYLLITGARPACIFGQICMIILLILSGGFAAGLFFGNRFVADSIGDFIQIRAGWYVYAVMGLSILGFVLIALHKTRLRRLQD